MVVNSNFSSNLSTSCSSALNSIAAFATSTFIAPRYDEAESEAKHKWIQKVEYRNYIVAGQPALPLIGLGPEATLRLAEQIPANGRTISLVSYPISDEPN